VQHRVWSLAHCIFGRLQKTSTASRNGAQRFAFILLRFFHFKTNKFYHNESESNDRTCMPGRIAY
jgi:hypothetical protein